MKLEVYSGYLKLVGEEHSLTFAAALNYAISLIDLRRFEEAKALLRKMMPVARRVLGECHELTLRMRANYAAALISASGATLDDFREAVATLEDAARIARRVMGGAHPTTKIIEGILKSVRETLRARESPST